MYRIFATLAVLSIILMGAAMTIGLMVGDLHADDISPDSLRLATIHRLTGIAAALVVTLVASIAVTYFIGTSRWCKEVCLTYDLGTELIARSNTLKRKSFPWALTAMFTVIVVAALGAAADPSTGRPGTAAMVDWHLIGSFVGIGLILWCYVALWNNIHANRAIIADILEEVHRVRTEMGLEEMTNAQ